MFKSLRSRLTLSHLIPVLVAGPLMALALLITIESQLLLHDLAGDLEARAVTMAQTAAGRPEAFVHADSAEALLAELVASPDTALYLYTPAGALISLRSAENELPPIAADDLEQVRAGESTIEIRYNLIEPTIVVQTPVISLQDELLGILAVSESVYGAASSFRQLRWLVLGMVGLELLAGLVLASILAARMSRPIVSAAQGVSDIAEGRDFTPLQPAGATELRQLSSSVNLLAERLDALEEMRRQSLANVVHEIGRPLGAIKSAVHVLRQGAGDDPALREELLSGINDEIDRISPQLDDLAQLHAQVLGRTELHLQPTEISKWLPPVLLPWRAAALEKGLEWRVDIAPQLPLTALDSERMAQVVGNLLSNAVKYTPAPGLVAVEAKEAGGETLISVSDSGPGIAVEEQVRVFEPFFRSARERRFPQGLGLGLPIARELVAAHGGRLELESAPGAGSRFTIYLPTGDE